jgi:hypothetical protein
MENLKVEIETAYSPETDMTFILKETIKIVNGEEECISTEVKGFYYGEPDEDATKEFYGKLKADYTW